MILLRIVIKAICFAMFAMISTFTFMYGKSGTGVKAVYAVTAIFFLGVIVFL